MATEDERSARDYLRQLAGEEAVRQQCRVTFAEFGGPDPMTVVKTAKEYNIANGPFEEVWVVFDTEGAQNPSDRHTKAKHAIDCASQLGINLAVSNTCFEVWLLLHYETYPGILADADAAYNRLRRKYIPTYSKGHDCYKSTRDKLDIARKNASNLFKTRFSLESMHVCNCNPSSQIYLLMDSLFGGPAGACPQLQGDSRT